jgi:hypothetical protein
MAAPPSPTHPAASTASFVRARLVPFNQWFPRLIGRFSRSFVLPEGAIPDSNFQETGTMKKANSRKKWGKPSFKPIPIFFECTCYAGAV